MAPIKKGFNNYKVVGDKTVVYLEKRNGDIYETIIDTKNLKRLIDLDYRWHLIWEKNIRAYYAVTHIYEMLNGKRRGKDIYLAKFLMNCPNEFEVDHINHDTLYNVESNLKIVTYSENERNRKGRNSNNKTGYRNVCQSGGYLYVQWQVDGKGKSKIFHLNQLEEAGRFAEEMRKKHYGEFSGGN